MAAADSRAIQSGLNPNGFPGGRDYLVQEPDNSGREAAVPAQDTSFINSIREQLRICYPEHTFFSDDNRRVPDFLNTYR